VLYIILEDGITDSNKSTYFILKVVYWYMETMETTMVIKTNKKLRNEAKAVAGNLGIPLTTVLNALLKQFVREQRLTVSSDATPTKTKLALWEEISAEMDSAVGVKSFSDVEDLIKDLRLA